MFANRLLRVSVVKKILVPEKRAARAALNSVLKTLRFAPYRISFSLRIVTVKREHTPWGNFGEGPGEIRTHDLLGANLALYPG
jgi:hypothetical protein